MVQTFKIMRGYGKIRREVFFEKYGERETARTRIAAGFENLVIPRFRSEIRKHAFSVRVVKSWNRLPDGVKQAQTLIEFKNGLRKFIENGGRPGYD
jgi:hypothetical protein